MDAFNLWSDDYPTSYADIISIPSFSVIQKKTTASTQSPKQNRSTTSTVTPLHPEATALTINSTNNNQQTQAERSKVLELFDTNKCQDEYKDQLKEVLWNNINSFAATHHELGRYEIIKHDIELSDSTPIKQKYRRIPPHMFDTVKEELNKLHEQGVIRPSMSPRSSPISIAVKSYGGPRLCIDLRKVNELTKKDAKSIPNVQEMFDRLNGKTIFSSLDFYSEFLQIELEEHCKEIAAFICGPLGFLEMNRLPFGACNSSATFQRTMETVLGNILHTIALVCIDDIIIQSSSPSDHIQSLDKIFKCLNDYGLHLKPSKCAFFSNEIKFLGHMVTSRGLEKDPSKYEQYLTGIDLPQ